MASKTDISQVAARIADVCTYSPESPAEIAAQGNANGWAFEVRYPGQTYLGDDSTRVEGLVLSHTDLATAVAQATAILAGTTG